MRHPLLVALFIAGTTASLAAQTNPSFELNSSTSAGGCASAIVQGDFNNDGKPDLIQGCGPASTGYAQDAIALQLGNGDGTFQAPVVVGTPGPNPGPNGGQIDEMIAADLDHDGNLDLVLIRAGDVDFTVFYGNGNGTFQPPLTVSTAAAPETLAVGDFNGDGYLGVAVGDYGYNNVEIFNNVGGRTFAPGNVIQVAAPSTSSGILGLSAGNLDGNGTADLAALTFTAAYVLWGDGHGDFTPVELKAYPDTSKLNIGDLNQDGTDDVLISYNCGTGPNANAFCNDFDVFYGHGNKTTSYLHAVTDTSSAKAGQPWAADVNGDGIADIVAPAANSSGGDGLFVWLGKPNGTFNQTGQSFIGTTSYVAPIVPGDWNRDGMIDFASPSSEVYINATNRAPCATSQINATAIVCQPVDNTYSTSPVHVQATAYDTSGITDLQEYVDNKLAYSKDASSFSTTLAESPGPHYLVTKAWSHGVSVFSSGRNITVYTGTPEPVCAAALGAASICLPTGATSTSPVHILANGYATAVPTDVQLYVDGNLVINNEPDGNSYLDTNLTLSSGNHSLTFKLWDAAGHTYTAQKTVTVD